MFAAVRTEERFSNDSLAATPPSNGNINQLVDEDSPDGAPTHQDAIMLQIPEPGLMSDGETSCDDTLTQNSITKLLSTKLKTYRTSRYNVNQRMKAQPRVPGLTKRLTSKYESQDYDQCENTLFMNEQEMEKKADSFSFECRGCTKMKELEVELEQVRLLSVAMVGREQVGYVSGSGLGTVDDKVGEDDKRDARESSLQPGRRLGGDRTKKRNGREDKWIEGEGVRETVMKETMGKEMTVKAMGVREMRRKVTGGKALGAHVSQEMGGKGDMLMGERETDNRLPSDKDAGQNVMEGIHRKSYSEVVIEGVRKRARMFVGDSIVRKTDRVLNKGDDVAVCLPGAKIEAITERVENIVGSGKGGFVLVDVGTNNVEREGTTAIVRKYRNLVRTLKQTWVEQVILLGILPVIGRRGHRYRNCWGMAINMLVQKLCREEEVEFVGRADMYMKDGLHLSGKRAAVFADGQQQ
ncbi:hypothetical protein LSAT2_011002 [Lamellibrachia satsuma]|nr:hypothetical protein LSAT2_011002 [Lamellibrachia satsuma]